MTEQCTKCRTILVDNAIKISSAIGRYGIIGDPLPDNHCPGGGGHSIVEMSDYNHHDQIFFEFLRFVFFIIGFLFALSTLFKAIIFFAFHKKPFNKPFSYMDYYSTLVAAIGILFWVTQHIKAMHCQTFWLKVAKCCCHCFVTDQLKFIFVKLLRRPFVGLLYMVVWVDALFDNISFVGFSVLLAYWSVDFCLCLYELSQTRYGKCVKCNNYWSRCTNCTCQHVTDDSQIGVYCCFMEICVMPSDSNQNWEHDNEESTDNLQ